MSDDLAELDLVDQILLSTGANLERSKSLLERSAPVASSSLQTAAFSRDVNIEMDSVAVYFNERLGNLEKKLEQLSRNGHETGLKRKEASGKGETSWTDLQEETQSEAVADSMEHRLKLYVDGRVEEARSKLLHDELLAKRHRSDVELARSYRQLVHKFYAFQKEVRSELSALHTELEVVRSRLTKQEVLITSLQRFNLDNQCQLSAQTNDFSEISRQLAELKAKMDVSKAKTAYYDLPDELLSENDQYDSNSNGDSPVLDGDDVAQQQQPSSVCSQDGVEQETVEEEEKDEADSEVHGLFEWNWKDEPVSLDGDLFDSDKNDCSDLLQIELS